MKENYTKKEFRVSTDLSQVQQASADILTFLKPLRLTDGHTFDLRLCLEEALINAMKYGNQLDKNLPVKVLAEYSPSQVRLTVEDQGSGFDPKKLADCTTGDNLLKGRGRGVYLIHQLMDEAHYNDKGNSLLMVKFINKPDGTKPARPHQD